MSLSAWVCLCAPWSSLFLLSSGEPGRDHQHHWASTVGLVLLWISPACARPSSHCDFHILFIFLFDSFYFFYILLFFVWFWGWTQAVFMLDKLCLTLHLDPPSQRNYKQKVSGSQELNFKTVTTTFWQPLCFTCPFWFLHRGAVSSAQGHSLRSGLCWTATVLLACDLIGTVLQEGLRSKPCPSVWNKGLGPEMLTPHEQLLREKRTERVRVLWLGGEGKWRVLSLLLPCFLAPEAWVRPGFCGEGAAMMEPWSGNIAGPLQSPLCSLPSLELLSSKLKPPPQRLVTVLKYSSWDPETVCL